MKLSACFAKIFSRGLWLHLLAMPIVMVLLGYGAFALIDRYTRHGQAITIPDLRGERTEVVIRKLEALGLRVEVADTGYNARKPADIVLAQSLAPGTVVKPDRLISLTINAAAPIPVLVPDLTDNCSLREARMKLEALGFTLGPIRRVAGDLDWVYRVLVGNRPLRPGERVSTNRPIILEVGNGKNYEQFNGNDSLDFKLFASDSVVYESIDEEVDAEDLTE